MWWDLFAFVERYFVAFPTGNYAAKFFLLHRARKLRPLVEAEYVEDVLLHRTLALLFVA